MLTAITCHMPSGKRSFLHRGETVTKRLKGGELAGEQKKTPQTLVSNQSDKKKKKKNQSFENLQVFFSLIKDRCFSGYRKHGVGGSWKSLRSKKSMTNP